MHWNRPALSRALLTSGLLLAASPAFAASGLQINVLDEATGKPEAGVTVIIANPGTGFSREMTTDAYGQVRLDNITTAGAYELSVAADDDHESVSASVQLRSNFTQSVTLSRRAATTQVVIVKGVRNVSRINTVNAENSASLNTEELQALPIEGRDVVTSLIRLPNVVPSTGFFPEAPVVSINGANGLFTNYLLDGLDNNENFLGGLKFPVPLGFTRDVTVLASSYSAIYGRSNNGVVNYTSPSGTNDFHGEVYALVRPGRPLDAQSPYPRRDLSGNAVGESFARQQAGISVGGPIVRNQTFFYANLELTRDENENIVDAPVLNTVGNVTGRNRFALGSFKLDHHHNDQWSFSARANLGDVRIDRPGGALGAGNSSFPSAGSEQVRKSTLIAAQARYTGVLWTYDGSIQFSRFQWDYAEPKGPAGAQVTARDETGLTIATVGHPGYVFNDLETSWQTQHRFQRHFGDHRLSFGGDFIVSDFELLGGGNPQGNYTVELTPGQISTLNAQNRGFGLGPQNILALNPRLIDYSVELRPQSFGTDQALWAFYIEDEIRLSSKLTATLGLRWDYDSLTAKGTGEKDLDNFAPRLALNYRLDNRSSLRMGLGTFYGKLPYSVISDALQRNSRAPAFLEQLRQLQSKGIIQPSVNLSEVTFDGNLTVSPQCASLSTCPAPADVQGLRATAILNEARILNPNGYESPYSHQFSLGYQRQVSSEITFGADLIYSRSYNLVRLRDLNTPTAFTPDATALTQSNIALLRAQPDNASRFLMAQSLGLVRSQAAADATRPVALAPGGARQITVSETKGRSTYSALNLQVTKARGDDTYAYRVVYTLSKLTNNTDDINFRASNANDFSADYGPSANDRRHVISAVGVFYPVRNLTVSVAGLFQSGQPVNLVPDASIFGTQDLNGDGQSFGENYVGNSDRYPGEGRNSGRLGWSSAIDVGIRYDIEIPTGTLQVSADVFNLFNTNNESGFANAATTSNQIQLGGGAPYVQRNAGPPRQFQFGLAWKF